MSALETDKAVQPHNAGAAALWDAGGSGYDEISRGISDAISHAVQRLNPKAGEYILDLATGTGWTSREVARRGPRVVGVDIGEQLIAAANDRARSDHLEIDYRVGDAEALPFDDQIFDAVVSTFGIMFASRPEAAAAELARVTRPGGRIVLTTWFPDSNPAEMFRLMKPYMPSTPSPAPPSPFEWGSRERVQQLLGDSFDLKFEDGTSYYREPTGEATWETFSKNFGPTRALANSLDASKRDELKRGFVAFHEKFRNELGICMPRTYLMTFGTKRSSHSE